MHGQVDLVNETQDLYARVEPSVGDSISAIVLVAVNPVWGLGALILDKILKNPFGQVLHSNTTSREPGRSRKSSA